MKLVEERTGTAEIASSRGVFSGVPYRLARYQALLPSGLPVPGVDRTEGALQLDAVPEGDRLVGTTVTLRLEDGRSLSVRVEDAAGAISAEGHGPGACLCC